MTGMLLGNGSVNTFPQTKNGTTPIVRQQILNNATVGQQQRKSCVFYFVRAERL
jgi:hypothetical protein